MKKEETYNGWTNYATWRVHLELFDGYEFEEKQTAESLKELADEFIFFDQTESICTGYARAFLSDVNWHEIAQHINEQLND